MTTTLANNKRIDLPDYWVVNGTDPSQEKFLRTPATAVTFPLSAKDRDNIEILVAKFDAEENMVGLAAPQIGIPLRAIVFAVIDGGELKKWRPDLTQTMEKTVWLNPSWEPIGNEQSEDYEACFSVLDLAGNVSRYTRISYQAYDLDGNFIVGEAEGFLARVIQHEIDHINGKLFIDYVRPEDIISISAYREKRANAVGHSDA